VHYYPWVGKQGFAPAGVISIKTLLIFFSLLSFLFQIGPAVLCWDFYINSVMREGANPFRWVEYSFSASCLTLAAAALLGETDIFVYITTFVATWTIMALGLIQEYWAKHLRCANPNVWLSDYLLPHLVGWPLFVVIWAGLIARFVLTLRHSADSGGAHAPKILVVFYVGEATLFALFGIAQLTQQVLSHRYYIVLHKHEKWRHLNVNFEYVYTLLSLFAKSMAALIITFGLTAHNHVTQSPQAGLVPVQGL
jgi:hypothetical protein